MANVLAELGVGMRSQDAAADLEGVPHSAAAACEPHGAEDNIQAAVGRKLTGEQAHAPRKRVQEAQTHTTGAQAQARTTGAAEGMHWTEQRPIDVKFRLATPCRDYTS